MEKVSRIVVSAGPTIGKALSNEEMEKPNENESRKIFEHFWKNHWKEYKNLYWKELDT